MGRKRERKQTTTQQIMEKVYDRLKMQPHDLTRKQYGRQAKQYIKFCREQFNCRSFNECASHITKHRHPAFLREKLISRRFSVYFIIWTVYPRTQNYAPLKHFA